MNEWGWVKCLLAPFDRKSVRLHITRGSLVPDPKQVALCELAGHANVCWDPRPDIQGGCRSSVCTAGTKEGLVMGVISGPCLNATFCGTAPELPRSVTGTPLHPSYLPPFSGTIIDGLPLGINSLLFADKRCKGQRGDVTDIFKGTFNQR
ncbi:hypothetical protein J1605_016873 [Eschrichtius robustus]|uniref:Uncharacterized protein n=1 Tax=Eschrichtius robustus TaxID=9764 RepID=A0AB34I4Y3_ESCRO|nr:hypothetical protein J1605_016873 [Eschrichtius robustus]